MIHFDQVDDAKAVDLGTFKSQEQYLLRGCHRGQVENGRTGKVKDRGRQFL
jgi:hypothetical protein